MSLPSSANYQKVGKGMAVNSLFSTFSYETLQFWDVEVDVFQLPPIFPIIGSIVNSTVQKVTHTQRMKRISIELHRMPIDIGQMEKEEEGGENGYYEKCFVRIMRLKTGCEEDSDAKEQSKDHVEEENEDEDDSFQENESLASATSIGDDCSWEHTEMSNGAFEDVIVHMTMMSEKDQEADSTNSDIMDTKKNNWETENKLPLYNVSIKDICKKKCKVALTINREVQEQVFFFPEDSQVQEFSKILELQKSRMDERRDQKMEKAIQYSKQQVELPRDLLDSSIQKFLVEIVGAVGCDLSNVRGSFVKVRFGEQLIHKTKIIRHKNPIWTVRSKAFFIFETSWENLFDPYKRLTLILCEGKGREIIGATTLSPIALLQSNAERIELEMKPYSDRGKIVGKDQGTLAIRCRHATESDLSFLENKVKLHDNEHALMTKMKYASRDVGASRTSKASSTEMKTFIDEEGEEVIKHKVKPFPDSDSEFEFMSSSEFDAEMMNPSQHFKELGNGKLGKVWLEVLECSDLPEKDLWNRKTDAFVTIVYEDSYSQTNVIDDCLSPKWMPWTERGFCLNIKHTSSPVYLGVFDYDAEGPFQSHDLIGRIVIDITKLKPRTEYILKYSVWDSTNKSDRKKNGEIMIRLRMELESPQRSVVSGLNQPLTIQVYSHKAKEHKCIKDSCMGADDEKSYSLAKTLCLVEEVLGYKDVLIYAQEVISNILFWRPTYPLTIRVPCLSKKHSPHNEIKPITFYQKWSEEKVMFLPVASVMVLIAFVTGVERPDLFPTILFFLMGTYFASVLQSRSKHPNPWARSASFFEILSLMLFGKFGRSKPELISPHENEKESIILKYKHANLTLKAKDEAIKENILKTIKDIGGHEASELSNAALNFLPLKPILHPIQLMLVQFIRCLRVGRNILKGDEPYVCFWLSITSLLLSILFFVVPWFHFFKLLARTLVLCFLGPWMKFFDVVGLHEKYEHHQVLKRQREKENLITEIRIEHEDLIKRNDMNKFLFGDFVSAVPLVKVDRLLDNPLPSSYAVPYDMEVSDIKEAKISKIVTGQNFDGRMLPKVTNEMNDLVLEKGAGNPRDQHDTKKTRVLSFAYDGVKEMWTFGKQIIVLKPLISGTEIVAKSALAIAAGSINFDTADEQIQRRLNFVDENMIEPLLTGLCNKFEK